MVEAVSLELLCNLACTSSPRTIPWVDKGTRRLWPPISSPSCPSMASLTFCRAELPVIPPSGLGTTCQTNHFRSLTGLVTVLLWTLSRIAGVTWRASWKTRNWVHPNLIRGWRSSGLATSARSTLRSWVTSWPVASASDCRPGRGYK